MSAGLVGRKMGMSRVFTPEGNSVPVTVVEILPNRITQVRTRNIDGYDGIQITTGERRPSRVSKPMKGHFAKAGVEPGRGVWEFRLEQEPEISAGQELTIDLLKEGMKVDVSGRSIGKGFSGTMKRYGFGGGRASHGNSKAHRLAGSIGNAQDPGRVFKGKKMAGHEGNENVVQQNLDIVKVDGERNIVLISGSIPGSKGSDVIVRPAIKSRKKTDILANFSYTSDYSNATHTAEVTEVSVPIESEVPKTSEVAEAEETQEKTNAGALEAEAADESAETPEPVETGASEPVGAESSASEKATESGEVSVASETAEGAGTQDRSEDEKNAN